MMDSAAASESQEKCPFMKQEGWDFTNPDLLEQGIPIKEFAELRETAPVWWNAQLPGKGGGFHDGGYWVISRHKDIREISKNAADWSTAENGAIIRFEDDMSQEQIDVTKAILINQDPPVHTQKRKIVSRSSPPRPSVRWRRSSTLRLAGSSRRLPKPARAISSTRSPSTCRWRPSPTCSACRRWTASSSSTGPTR